MSGSTGQDAASVLDAVRQLYATHGIKALSTTFLENTPIYHRMRKAKISHAVLLEKLGFTSEYDTWRLSSRTYRGKTKPKWTWEIAVATAKALVEREGDLPTVEWCRLNGYSQLTNVVHLSRPRRTWEDLRTAVGSFATSKFVQSRNCMRWLSQGEASLSNFFYARGIEHRKGELCAPGYSEQSGRNYGRLDMHFLSHTGNRIDVEVWGDISDTLTRGRYKATRALKEKWQASNPNFLGIEYRDCLSDVKLTKILAPYIGIVEPFQFDKPTDHFIETVHWNNYEELLASCKEFAAKMPDGIFPGESWLRKRGKHANRAGQTYNSLAIRVNTLLGGTRKVRLLLGHGHASTIQWTPERAIAEWRTFEEKHGLTPSQANAGPRRKGLPQGVGAEAGKIYQAVRLHGLLSEARNGRTARKIKWTPESAIAAWQAFHKKHGKTPSQCMSSAQRQKLPRTTTDEATNIYGAVKRLGVLARAKATT